MTDKKNLALNGELYIKQLVNGSEAAYESLFKTFYTELVMHANKYLQDIELSKEVVQDLFVTIYEKRKHLSISTSLRSYLYRAVQNRCINQINSFKTKEKYAGYVKRNVAYDSNETEDNLHKTELEHALFEAIRELPPKCAMIFKMNRFEGFTNGEIAERLSLSKRTVETQITKALKLLRVKLKPFMQAAFTLLFMLNV